jgi:hypothetical protein
VAGADGSGDGEATVYVFNTSTKATLFSHPGGACQLSPDGTVVCIFELDSEAGRVYHVATGALVCALSFLFTVKPNNGAVHCCVLNWQNTRLVTTADKRLLLWGIAAGEDDRFPIAMLDDEHSDDVSVSAFSPDGTTLLSGSEDGTVRLWDTSDGTCKRVLPLDESGTRYTNLLLCCAFSMCGGMLALVEYTHTAHPTAKLWAVASGRCVRTINDLGLAGVSYCAFSPDGSKLLFLNCNECMIVVHDVSAERDRCSPAAGAAALAAPPAARCDLLALLRSGDDADVVLRTACGREFKAHRAILRLRSSTLKAQLSGAYADSRAVVAVAADIPAPVLERLLHFIYAEELSPPVASRDEAAALLAAASFFGVPRLGAGRRMGVLFSAPPKKLEKVRPN